MELKGPSLRRRSKSRSDFWMIEADVCFWPKAAHRQVWRDPVEMFAFFINLGGKTVALETGELDGPLVARWLRDGPKILPELRFWVANQGVAINVITNYRASPTCSPSSTARLVCDRLA